MKKKYKDILKVTNYGLYCPSGNFYIDAKSGVPLNLITHGHADHARYGSTQYLSAIDSKEILHQRIGKNSALEVIPYNEKIKIGKAWVSFHSAGHIMGSSQIRVEVGSDVWVVTGDYKRQNDPSCAPFEIVPCNTLITETTFALPIYDWKDENSVILDLYNWWQENNLRGFASVVFCYALGKAQRILAMLQALTKDTIYLHGAIVPFVKIYRDKGIVMPPTSPVSELPKKGSFAGKLILAPPSANNTPWIKKFYPYRTAATSGWMAVRGAKRWANYDRGFVLSDHVDWKDLLQTIKETKATNILTTHGFVDIASRYIQENLQLDSEPLGMTLGEINEDEE